MRDLPRLRRNLRVPLVGGVRQPSGENVPDRGAALALDSIRRKTSRLRKSRVFAIERPARAASPPPLAPAVLPRPS